MAEATYTTVSGDTWDGIAYAQLGDERYLDLLILANPTHAYLTRLPAGLVLRVPARPTPDPAPNLPPWRRP
jgi:hypothetical protein